VIASRRHPTGHSNEPSLFPTIMTTTTKEKPEASRGPLELVVDRISQVNQRRKRRQTLFVDRQVRLRPPERARSHIP
jgi:hypothetical protein